jgi:prolyl-tRNA synthetase
MRQSKFFIPTLKEVPGDAQVVSHQLLLRAGLIKQVAAGVYTYLPLAKRVLNRVEAIIREELEAIGSCELFMPVLHPKELWDQTGRWEVYGPELMRMKDRHGREFALGPTHEEVITTLIADDVKSYKKLPLNVFQIQTKFRDELRPRFGLMRGREFLMKDAYSFHANDACLDATYDDFVKAYTNIFTRCGLDFRMVEADNGQIGGTGSAEFMALADIGEDTIVYDAEGSFAANIEVADLKEGDTAPNGTGVIKHAKGVELGHVFKLGTKYSEALNGYFLDENGKRNPYVMGCYGIGVSRILMAAIEQNNDENGMIWPKSIAPFDVHLIAIDIKNEEQAAVADELYEQLGTAGYDILLDDRHERPGIKFSEADLIGLPIRITVGRRAKEGIVEVKVRRAKEAVEVAVCDLMDYIQSLSKDLA